MKLSYLPRSVLLFLVTFNLPSAQSVHAATEVQVSNDVRSTYLRAVHAKLATIAFGRLRNPAAAHLVADMVLLSDGTIKSVVISKSSGDAVFDQRVIDLYKGQSVPPRPAGFGQKELIIRLPVIANQLAKSFAENKWKSTEELAKEYSLQAISNEEREELNLIIGSQLRKCWKSPVLRQGEILPTVKMLWEVNVDGTVASPIRWLDLPLDSAAKKAVAAAADAIVKCQPLKLPTDKYAKWKTIEWSFDPGQLR